MHKPQNQRLVEALPRRIEALDNMTVIARRCEVIKSPSRRQNLESRHAKAKMVQDAVKQASNNWKRKPEDLMPQAILPDIEDLRRCPEEFHAGLALLSTRVPHDAAIKLLREEMEERNKARCKEKFDSFSDNTISQNRVPSYQYLLYNFNLEL